MNFDQEVMLPLGELKHGSIFYISVKYHPSEYFHFALDYCNFLFIIAFFSSRFLAVSPFCPGCFRFQSLPLLMTVSLLSDPEDLSSINNSKEDLCFLCLSMPIESSHSIFPREKAGQECGLPEWRYSPHTRFVI